MTFRKICPISSLWLHVNNIPYNRIKKSRHDVIRKVVLNGTNSSGGPVSRLVNELQASSKSVSIPDNFAFLKSLSDRYADTLRRKNIFSEFLINILLIRYDIMNATEDRAIFACSTMNS